MFVNSFFQNYLENTFPLWYNVKEIRILNIKNIKSTLFLRRISDE